MGLILPEYRISKEFGIHNFNFEFAIDFDINGNVIFQEFFNGVSWTESPSDIRWTNSFCDEDKQNEWNLFFYDFMNLLERGEISKHCFNLKNIGESYFFNDEDIKIELIEED